MGDGCVGDVLSQGVLFLGLARILDAEPRYVVGYHRWAEDGDRRIPPCALLLEQAEGAT